MGIFSRISPSDKIEARTGEFQMTFRKNKTWRRCQRMIFVGSCLLSSTNSFTYHTFRAKQPSRLSGQDTVTRRPLSLHQTSTTTTTTLQETTVTLQWMEFYNPGETREIPVLLLHGLLGSKRNFATLASSLGNQLEKPRRIFGVDLRNHGDSDHAPDMTYPAMAKDVLDFMDAQSLDRVILVGHSMGGKVAQTMSLLHPHRVEGLVVLDIAPVQYTSLDSHWKAVEDIMHAMRLAGDASTKSDLDKKLRPSIPDPNLRAFVLTNFDVRRGGWKIPVTTICEQLEHIAGFDLPEHATIRYEGDVFIIHGGQSRFVRHAYMDRIAELFPNHMLTTVRGAGHWVHAEAPDDTIALLKQYLDR